MDTEFDFENERNEKMYTIFYLIKPQKAGKVKGKNQFSKIAN